MMALQNPMTATAAAHRPLVEQIAGMLAYWRQVTAEVTANSIIHIDRERQNLLRAVQVGLFFPQTRFKTAEILVQAFPFAEQRGYWREWVPLLEKCLEHSQGWATGCRVMLLARLGQARRLDNQFEEAIAFHLEAERLARSTGQKALLGRAQHDLLEDYLFARQFEKGKAIGLAAIETTETAEETAQLAANCYKMLGTLYTQSGDPETGLGYSQTAVRRWRRLAYPLYLARALVDLATPLVNLQRYEEAQARLLEAADLLESTIYELDKSNIQHNLGTALAAQKRYEEAEAAFHRANSAYLRQSLHFPRKARVNNNLGYVLFHQGKHEMAELYLHQSVAIWEQIGDGLETANTLSTLADCLCAREEFQSALPLYERVIELLEQHPGSVRAERLLKEYLPVRERLRQQAEK